MIPTTFLFQLLINEWAAATFEYLFYISNTYNLVFFSDTILTRTTCRYVDEGPPKQPPWGSNVIKRFLLCNRDRIFHYVLLLSLTIPQRWTVYYIVPVNECLWILAVLCNFTSKKFPLKTWVVFEVSSQSTIINYDFIVVIKA